MDSNYTKWLLMFVRLRDGFRKLTEITKLWNVKSKTQKLSLGRRGTNTSFSLLTERAVQDWCPQTAFKFSHKLSWNRCLIFRTNNPTTTIRSITILHSTIAQICTKSCYCHKKTSSSLLPNAAHPITLGFQNKLQQKTTALLLSRVSTFKLPFLSEILFGGGFWGRRIQK